jgi:Uma2 family endonuclease
MSTAAATTPSTQIAPVPPRETIADLLHRLGDVPADRVRLRPFPGTATFEDLIHVNEHRDGPTCEWVENALVEKPMGFHESWLAIIIGGELYAYLKNNDVGMIAGEAGVMKILPTVGRAPDVSFIAWASLPGGKPPPRSDKVPAAVPDLAIEVLSASNTPGEMARKRDEYFRAGVKLVWEIDPASRSANVFTGPNAVTPVSADGTLDGGTLLPGFTLSLRDLFDRVERRA